MRTLRSAVHRPPAMLSPARCTTASDPSSCAASMAPASGSQRTSPGADVLDRTRRTIVCPCAERSGASAEPMSPVDPLIRIFIAGPPYTAAEYNQAAVRRARSAFRVEHYIDSKAFQGFQTRCQAVHWHRLWRSLRNFRNEGTNRRSYLESTKAVSTGTPSSAFTGHRGERTAG